MSELVSAFAAYRMNGTKNGAGARKSASSTAKKSSQGAKSKTSKTTKAKSGAKVNGRTTTAAKSGAKSKTATKPKKSPTRSNGAKKKPSPAAKPAASKAKVMPKPKSTTRKSSTTASKSKSATGRKTAPRYVCSGGSCRIRADDVDMLVDKYLTNPKKLSEADEKMKKKLERYLARQLASMSDEDDEYTLSEGSSYEGEEDDEDEDDDFEDEEEEETDSYSESYSETDDEVQLGRGDDKVEDEGEVNQQQFFREASGEEKNVSRNARQKRKSDENIIKAGEENQNGSGEEKRSRNSENTRNSLPATEKPIEYMRRSLGGNQTASTDTSTNISTKTNVFVKQTPSSDMIKLEALSPPGSIVKMNSVAEGEKILRWLLQPVLVEDFFAKYWEKTACLVKRHQANFFSHLISFQAIDEMLIKHHVEFTKNIDVTSYKNGVRETLNPEGRAMPPVVWDHYGQGCSIRLLNPHTFMPALFTLNTTLQEYFHCLVGANVYLTPPNSQGFAPHYDDIEAFVLQIEGRKRWKLYSPRHQKDMLPRYSSQNFSQDEIGTPILEQVLQPGDVLYFPRGTIHQACTEPGYHSLHITLSVYQKQSFADLLEQMVPLMLQRAIAENVDLRRGLPLHTWHHAGVAFSENDTKERVELLQKVRQLVSKCVRDIPMHEVMDDAVDQLAKKYQREALPPEILPSERLRTVFGSRNRTNEQGECVCDYDIELRTNVRLLRANIMRLVAEEQKIRIYYYLDNSREYCEYEPNFIEIDPREAASVEVLIKSYPAYVGVSQLPLEDDDHKIQVVTGLWERGLLMMEKPFK